MLVRPLIALLSWPAPSVPQGATTLVTRLGEAEIARETVDVTDEGWSSEVAVDLPGQKVSYRASLAREEGSVRWMLEILPEDEGSPVVTAEYSAGAVEVVWSPGEKTERFQVTGPDPFFFENLCWAVLIEPSRELVRRAEAGELEDGGKLTAILAQHTRTIPLELTGHGRVEGSDLWRFEVDMAGLGVEWTCAADGVPVRVAVPAQGIVVLREGAPPETSEKHTSVDSGPWREHVSRAEHEVKHEEDLRVPMRDGVELAVDVYRPDAEGEFPAILVRTPYDRGLEGLTQGARFAKRGYAVVVQDVRGRFDSDGVFDPLRHEMQDGSDTLDWMAARPWCDGNIGMIGGSYVGWVQWYAAKSKNPHLKAIVPQVAPPDPDQNFPYEGGAFLLTAAWWSKLLTFMDEGGAGIPDVDFFSLLATLPLGDLDEALDTDLPFLDEWLAHPPDDEEYWGPVRYQPHLPEMDVAALHVTGWFDGDQPGALQNFPVMRRSARTERARKGQFLVVGPWGHAFNLTSKVGDVDFGDEGTIDLQALELRFFDRYLKGVENGIEDEDPVWVFVMGENRWRRAPAWPLPEMEPTPLYLDSDGDARTRDGNGRLSLAPPAGGADELVYDPHDLPEPIGGWDDLTGQLATMDMATLEDREDTLDYTSPPLAGPVELTGPFEALLWVRSSAADADFVVAVHKLSPDGRMLRICAGIQRVRYRDGKDAPVPPGEVAKITVDCWASSIRLEKGDRIRIEVGPTGFPGYARNLGTLEPLATATEAVVATNRVLHDPEHPSHLVLPVVPREDAPGIAFAEYGVSHFPPSRAPAGVPGGGK